MAVQNRYTQAEEDALGRSLQFGGFGTPSLGFQGGQVDATTGNLRPGSEVDISKGTKPAEVVPEPEPEKPGTTPPPVTPVTPPPAPTPEPAPPPPAPVDPLSNLPRQQAMLTGRNQWSTLNGSWKRGGANGLYFVPDGMDDARGQQLTSGTFGTMNIQRFFGMNKGGMVPVPGRRPRDDYPI